MSKRKRETRVTARCRSQAEPPATRRAGTQRELVLVCAAVVLLAGAIWAVYGRAIHSPLIFDDKVSVIGNLSIEQLWPLVGSTERPGPLRPPHHNPVSGRPVVNLTLALNYHYGGLDPAGYHVLNICLHVLVALVLFAIVRRSLRLPYFRGRLDHAAGPLALAIALVWAVHPLQTETVVYITQRTELMVAFFYLATLYCALRYWAATTRGRRAAWLGLAVLASLAGMASKEVMVSAPIVVLLFERTFIAGSFSRAWRQSWPLYVGLAATWALLLALNYNGPRSDSAGFHLGVPLLAWWLTQAKVLWMYLKLVVWPWPLAIHYGMPYVTALDAAWPWVLGVVLLTAAVLLLVWRNRPAGVLGAFALLILAPTSIVPITTEVAAERRMYLPLAAVAALAVVGGYLLVEHAALLLGRERHQAQRWVLVAAGCVTLLVALGASVTSVHRLAVYQDPLVLWEDTIASQPDDPMAHYNLGVVLADRGRLQEGIRCFRRAIELKPNYGSAHYNLGNLLARVGQTQEAIDQYNRALRVNPGDANAHFNLGLILAGAGKKTEAIDEFELALRFDPNAADTHAELGYALAEAGRTAEAIAHFERAAELQPADAHVAYCYGSALLKANQIKEAIQRFRRALELNPDYTDAHNNLAYALECNGQTDEALEHARRAVELGPDRSDARSNLGVLLLRHGEIEGAIAEFQAALQINPDVWDTQVSLAGALRQAGRPQEAVEHYEQAVRLDPDNLTVYGNLAEAYILTGHSDRAIALTQEAVRIARSRGQAELADKIEAWVTSFQAGLGDSRDPASTSGDAPLFPQTPSNQQMPPRETE